MRREPMAENNVICAMPARKIASPLLLASSAAWFQSGDAETVSQRLS
jgi:hypothetical protein